MGFLLGIAVVIYFLPMLIGYGRERDDADWIAFLNLLLGWTIVGWLIALVRACSHPPLSRRQRRIDLLDRDHAALVQFEDAGPK